jgi:hypothetical protein
MRVKSYNATFVKTTGEERTMNFVRIGDLPDTFLVGKIKNTGKTRKLSNGLELVWDLDSKGFRTFNNNTAVGKVTTREVDIG